MRVLRRFLNDQSGATSIEYALIAIGVAIAIVTVVKGIGSDLSGVFTKVNTGFK